MEGREQRQGGEGEEQWERGWLWQAGAPRPARRCRVLNRTRVGGDGGAQQDERSAERVAVVWTIPGGEQKEGGREERECGAGGGCVRGRRNKVRAAEWRAG